MLKFVVLVLLATLAMAKASPPCLGCPAPLDDAKGLKEAENTLNNSLKQLAAGEGPVYKLGKINSATSQVIQGLLYKINADLIDENNKTKTCDIEIVDFQDVEITFKCPGEPHVTKKHSSKSD